jgi:hypothetical protein
MGTYNIGMAKVKIIVLEFDGSNAREETRWVNKIKLDTSGITKFLMMKKKLTSHLYI